MHSQNERRLHGRVVQAASKALAEKGWVSAIDVLIGIEWLTAERVEAWRRGEVPYLERVVQAGLGKVSAAMREFHKWAQTQGLKPSQTAYVRRKHRVPLRFSKSGDWGIEERYRTHWVSKRLAEAKHTESTPRARPTQRDAGEASERRVYIPHRESHCDGCGLDLERKTMIVLEEGKARCLECAGLGHLVYLRAGDALLTRRARAASGTHAVVLKWARARKRYERQGLLVEAAALEKEARDLGRDFLISRDADADDDDPIPF